MTESLSITLKVSLPLVTNNSLTVTLNHDKFPAGYTIPTNVIIPGGSSNTTFVVKTAPDGLLGDRVFGITGSVSLVGYTVVGGRLTVYDVDRGTGSTTITISSGAVTESLSITLKVSLPLVTNNSLTVTLNHDTFPAGYTIPTNVIIPGGSSNTTFVVKTAPDGLLGDRVFGITGSVSLADYTVVGGRLTVYDVDRGTGSTTITISSGTINESGSITLSASLPPGLKSITPITVTIAQTPAFPAPGYSINGIAITNSTFQVVIQPFANSVSFTIVTLDDGLFVDRVFNLGGNVSKPSFTVSAGKLTVTNSTVANVSITTTFSPANPQPVKTALMYTTVINNKGSSLSQTMFSIQTTGVDIIGYENIVTGLQKSIGVGAITYESGSSSPSAGMYNFKVTSFPSNASITLTYTGLINGNWPSAIHQSSISLPSPITNSNVGIAAVQTLIASIPSKPISSIVCSGAAINMDFTSIPDKFTRYAWSRTSNALITGPLSGTGSKLNDMLINTSPSISQTVTYTVTPQITATLVSSTGTLGGVTTTYGYSVTFTITVKPGNVTLPASSNVINVVATNANGYLILTPSAVGINNPKFRWYSSSTGIEGSINDGTVDELTGVRKILIAPPLDIGQRYDYYISVSGDNYCESDIGVNYVTISQLAILSFVDISGNPISSVKGGISPDRAYLRGSLPTGVVASSGPVTLSVVRSASSTAIPNTDYLGIDILGNLPKVVIPQGSNASPLSAPLTAQNRGVIGGSTILAVSSIAAPSYYYTNPSTITILDTSGSDVANRVVTLSSDEIREGDGVILMASLPILNGVTITVASPLTVTITSNQAFPSGYSISNGSQSRSIGGTTSFNVVIPAGGNAITYLIQTASDGLYTNRVFKLSGSTTSSLGLSFNVIPGALTVTNTDIPTDDAKIYLSLSTIAGGSTAIIKASLLKVNTSNDISVVVKADSPGFPTGYSVAGSNAFTITILKGSMYGTASVNTTTSLNTSFYKLTGLASDAASKAYNVYSGGLTVTGTSVADDQKVYLNSSIVAGGNVATIRASLSQANLTNDVTVIASAIPGFITGYSIVGMGGFTITITKGQLNGSITLSTTTDPYTYDYTLNGTASDGAKNYTVYSGNLKVTGADISQDQKIYLNTSTVAGGTAATIKATLLNPNPNQDIIVIVRADSPGFPANYSISGVNSLTITIAKGMMYGTATLNTTASTNTSNYQLNGNASDSTTKAYYVYSGGLTVTGTSVSDDQKIYLSSSTIAGGETGVIKATLLKVNSSADIVLTVRASAPGFIAGYSPTGVLPFTIKIPKGSLNGSASVTTIADASTYNYTLGGTAIDGSSKVYQVYSGDLIVTGSDVADNQKVYLSSSTVNGGSAAIIKATLLTANTNRDVNIVVHADAPGFLTGYVPSGVNSFTITIVKGSLYGEATVNTVANATTYDYVLNGDASDGSAKVYYVYSGKLRVIGSSVGDDQKVFISSKTIVGGQVGIIQATLGKINTSADVVVSVQADSPGFLSSYTPSGTNVFTITIPKGSLYGTSNVATTAAANTYNYTIGGTANDGSTKQYYVYSGVLTVLGQNIDPKQIVTISDRKILEGTSIDMTASLPSAASSNIIVSITPNPSLPTNYRVKVNGSYVALSAFSVTISAGEASAVFTVESADDSLSSSRSFVLNGATNISGYYVVSGNLTVLDKSNTGGITVLLRSSTATICGGVPLDLNDYIVGALPDISPAQYQYYSRYPGELMVSASTVTRAGTYVIYAVNPSGEVGTATFQVKISSSPFPVLSITPSITYYSPLAIDLTLPSLILSSKYVSSYKYYSDNKGTEVSDPKNVKVSEDQTFYIQGTNAQGCRSDLQPIEIKYGGDLQSFLEANVPTLVEGSSGYFTLSLKNSDGTQPVLQQNLSFTLSPDPILNEATPADYTLNNKGSRTISFVKEVKDVSIPIQALSDNVLYDDQLLAIDANNTSLGKASGMLRILDNTINDPANRVIVLEDGTIYYNEEITLRAYLSNGVITAKSLTIPLSLDAVNSTLNNLSSPPQFSASVTIPAGSNYGEFKVSGSSNSDEPAILKLNGTLTDFTVKGSTIRIINKKVEAKMLVSDNFDYINDWATIDNIEKYPNNEVAIINKWGVLVWLKKGYQNSRDGGFTGKYNQGRAYDLPAGTYYYVIRIWDNSTKPDIFKGSIELRRDGAD